MYYMLAGEHVFRGRSTMEVCAHHLHSEPVSIIERCPSPVSPALASLVMDCLAKDPGKRPQGAAEVLERLGRGPEAVGWSTRDARAWWAEHGAKLRSQPASQPGSGQSTIAIDLRHR